jgi:hypothetical protein
LWLSTNANMNPPYSWIEIGMISGTLRDGTQGFMWFWGEQDGSGIFGNHFIGWAATGRSDNASIYYEGSGLWTLFKGGHNIWSLTGNGNAGWDVQTGAEVTTTAMTDNGTSNNFQYRDSRGWHWVPANPYITPNAYGLFAFGANTGYFNVSTGCGGKRTGQPAAAPPAAPIPSSPAGAARALAAIAQRAAAASHQPAPARISYVKTTRRRAEQFLSHATVNDNQAVYVVELTGHFTHSGPPRSGAQPAGRTMTLTVDAATGQVTDTTISPARSIPLAGLGAVHSAP